MLIQYKLTAPSTRGGIIFNQKKLKTMKNVLYLVFALLFFQCPAQNSEVQFLEHITGNKIDFLVANPSSFPQEVNLQVTSAKGLRGNRNRL